MNTLRALSRFWLPALMLAVLTVCVTPAQAQAPKAQEALRPPNPTTPDKPPIIWNFLVIVVVLGLAGGAALIPSKRGHQD
jgi:hypothetical protein